MAAHGGGVIITTSSGGATRAHRGMTAYDASKGGIEALTRALALDLAPYGIRVVGLVPGLSRPTASRRAGREPTAATVPLGRAGVSEDMAGPAVFLASDDAAYVTGSLDPGRRRRALPAALPGGRDVPADAIPADRGVGLRGGRRRRSSDVEWPARRAARRGARCSSVAGHRQRLADAARDAGPLAGEPEPERRHAHRRHREPDRDRRRVTGLPSRVVRDDERVLPPPGGVRRDPHPDAVAARGRSSARPAPARRRRCGRRSRPPPARVRRRRSDCERAVRTASRQTLIR